MVMRQLARTFNRNHLIFFDEETLSRFLQQEGFEVLQSMTTVSVLDSILNQLQGLDPLLRRKPAFCPRDFATWWNLPRSGSNWRRRCTTWGSAIAYVPWPASCPHRRSKRSRQRRAMTSQSN